MIKTRSAKGRGKRLRVLREQMNLTRSQFAQNMGVSEHTLKSLENGVRELSASGAREYCRRFLLAGIDVSFDFLYHGNAQDHLNQLETTKNDEQRIQQEILNFKVSSPLSIIFKVQDSLMSPIYNKGDIVGGLKTTDESKFYLFTNHVCIIEAPHGAQYLRRIIKYERLKIICCTLNTDINNLSLVEELDALTIAQVTRVWQLSTLIKELYGDEGV